MPVYVSILGLHRDEKYWPQPDFFNPERFSYKNICSVLPSSYLPFGVGPHGCIGSRLGLLQIAEDLENHLLKIISPANGDIIEVKELCSLFTTDLTSLVHFGVHAGGLKKGHSEVRAEGYYWPQPDFFNPERFSYKNICSVLPSSYLPFGVGPHGCIGSRLGLLQVKLGLAHILRICRVEECFKTMAQLKFDEKSFMLKARGDLFLRFEKI
uniref:Cytochrome P450 n=1 Tax=Glossina morsitans morsitans TaxID=37546 RepID=A0A1B0G9Z9_GLOMM